jgi:predicted nucleic-acid-binding Zn-ribbon protein
MATEIDAQKFQDWLNTKWKGAKQCPICHSNDWNLSPRLVEVREYSGGSLDLGKPVFALVNITCNVCGYTLLFNAVVVGLAKSGKKQTASPKDVEKPKEGRKKT